MKKICFFALLVFSSFAIFGQNLSLSYPGGVLLDGDSIVFQTDANTPIITGANVFVHNNGASAINALCLKEVIDTVPGTKNAFCWGQCYGDTIYQSPMAIFIDAGDSTDTGGFGGEYKPNGHAGETRIRYSFSDQANRSNEISVVVIYRAIPASVSNFTTQSNKLTTAPNPASNQTTVDYSIVGTSDQNLRLIIKDLLGASIYSTDLSAASGKVYINTSDYANGIYFISIFSGSMPVSSKKLIIRH